MIKEKVFSLLRKIPEGKVTTYKALALKCKTSPRAIGKILNSNKDHERIPCYKVVMSDGKLGGYSGGMKKKISLLKKDGIEVKNNSIDKKHFYLKVL